MTDGWTLARPWALWLLAAALPLLWLHLRGLRRRRVVVPSLLLFEGGVAGGAPPVRAGARIRDGAGLLLELAALAALVLAAAGPERGADPPRHRPVALVLDGSASTMAGGRFEAQRARASALLRGLPADVPVSVLLAAGEVRVLAAPGDPRARVERALADARPLVCGAGALRDAALAAGAGGAEVVVFTDGCDGETGSLRALPGVAVVSVGTPLPNGALLGLEPDADGERFHATVRAADGSTGEWTAAVAPGPPPSLPIPRSPGDALAADDGVPALPARAARRPRVAVVVPGGTPDPFLQAALAAAEDRLDGAGSTVLAPGAAAPPGTDVLLAAGVEPPAGLPALVFRAGIEGAVPAVLPGEPHHPVMLGVDTAELVVARARALRREAGDAVLLDGPEGPLAVAGRRDGRRRVEVGFLPGESTLPLGAAFPVLVRNALLWLAGDRAPLLPPVLAAGVTVEVALPGGDREAALAGPFAPGAGASARRRPVPVRAGVLRFRVPWPESAGSALCAVEADGRTVAEFAVALLDAAESDLEPRVDPTPADAPLPVRVPAGPGRRDATGPLALLAALLLAGEYALYRARRRPAGAVRADSFPPLGARP